MRLAARDRSARPTLVFDEVDAGVGGRTARALGGKLFRLSEHTQLLCITHLPQSAALAERHFRVVKTAGEPSETRIDELTGDGVIEDEEFVEMVEPAGLGVAEDLDEGGAQSLDEAEEIVHQFEAEGEVKARIAAGDFGQALHVASFYLVLERLAARHAGSGLKT